jgi:ABC-type sugar transport system ATPase subunit
VANLLEIRNLSKTFPGLRALDDVSLDVAEGEVLAVVGQNGSGKSTLVKVLAGVHEPDDGAEIRVLTRQEEDDAAAAADSELRFIHQDLGLVPLLSTIENCDLTRPLTRRDLLPARTREERRRIEELIARFGTPFDVEVPVSELSPAQRTIVAIARSLDGWTRSDHVLILDEPTASLNLAEVAVLFEAVRRVAADGAGVIFISHRLEEVIDIADRVVALRDGRVVATAARGEFDHAALVRMIAGRDVVAAARGDAAETDTAVLSARDLAGGNVVSVDLDLCPGEIVGVTGLLGSGREDLAQLLFGAIPRQSGEVHVDGEELPVGLPREAIDRGVAYVPADRARAGAVMTMTSRENVTLPRLAPLRRVLGRLDRRAERADAARWMNDVNVVPPDIERPMIEFSGGNQQKVIIAKWLRTEPKVLLLDEPTQGVDVGSKAGIHTLVLEATRQGAAVLVSSSDVKELMTLSDRVLVMRDGHLEATIQRAELTEERLIRGALGGG